MGGLGPGIGGMEWVVIGIVALVVVGPERLPGLLRELGKWVAKARNMANEFRTSFDDMARQSELDDLRKEVEALRNNSPVRLGAEADAAFRDIRSEFDRPLFDPAPQPGLAEAALPEPVMTPAPTEWPVDTGAIDTSAPEPHPEPAAPADLPSTRPRTRHTAAAKTSGVKATSGKTTGAKATGGKTSDPKKPAKPRVSRSKVVDL